MWWWYPLFLLFSLLEMLFEWRISARNTTRLLSGGAIEARPDVLPAMSVIYAWVFIGSGLEFFLFPRSVSVGWASAFLILYLLAKALKFWAVTNLGQYWTMKVLIIPGTKVVTGGPYRWIKHPNYISVLMELAAVPLCGKNWITFVTGFLSFLIVLRKRIQLEEKALNEWTDYSQAMRDRKRFLP